MLAIADGKLSIIQYLLKNGADTEIQDYRKQKAADWAEERGNHEALSYITKHDQEKRRCCVGLKSGPQFFKNCPKAFIEFKTSVGTFFKFSIRNFHLRRSNVF